jgi:hypothetical protein
LLEVHGMGFKKYEQYGAVFLDKILITFLISVSLPITGSNFCSLASFTKS